RQPGCQSTTRTWISGVEGASWMTDSRGLGCADEGGCEVALDELDELIELHLLLQTQRRAEAVRLVQGVLVEGLGGGDAVATLKEPGALCREGRDVVEVFHGFGSSGWISLVPLYALALGVSLIPKCFTPYPGVKAYLIVTDRRPTRSSIESIDDPEKAGL